MLNVRVTKKGIGNYHQGDKTYTLYNKNKACSLMECEDIALSKGFVKKDFFRGEVGDVITFFEAVKSGSLNITVKISTK